MSDDTKQDEPTWTPQPETVVCVGIHPIDLDDGRTLAPGDRAESIDVAHPHNERLIESGDLLVLETQASAPKSSGTPATSTPEPSAAAADTEGNK